MTPGRLAAKGLLLLVVLAVAYVGATLAQVWRAAGQDGRRPADAIVVLGAAQYDGRPSPVLAARLDRAAELYRRGLAATVVLTGGRRPGDRFTEASAAAGYLIGRGVPEPALLLESSGGTSYQSLAAAARILRARGLDDVVVVTSPYHAYRAVATAQEVGLRASSSPTASPVAADDLLHEALAVSVGRIIGYRRLGVVGVRVGDRGPAATLSAARSGVV